MSSTGAKLGWLILNRPDSLNAHNVKMLSELPLAWKELDADDGVRVIVMTGKGRGFCAGADVKEVAASGGGMGDRMSALIESSEPVAHVCAIEQRLEASDCSSERSLRWLGLHHVAEADIAVASSSATFVDNHVSVGQTAGLEPIALMNSMPFTAVLRMALVGSGEKLERVRRLSSRLRDPGYRSTGAIRRDRPVPGRE